MVWILRTTWCSRRAVRHKEQYREFALTNQRQSGNLGFRTLRTEKHSSFYEQILSTYSIGRILLIWCFGTIAKFIHWFLVLREKVVLCWKVISKAIPPWQTLFSRLDAPLDIHSLVIVTPLWFAGNCVTSSQFVFINLVLCHCYLLL